MMDTYNSLGKRRVHPSDRIGEATSFVDALNQLEYALAYERDLFDNDSYMGDEPPYDKAFWDGEIARARRVRNRYRELTQAAERALVAELRASGDEHDLAIADALESGDYGAMAF